VVLVVRRASGVRLPGLFARLSPLFESMAANADEPNQGEVSPCTDRLSAGESCGAAIPEREPTGRPFSSHPNASCVQSLIVVCPTLSNQPSLLCYISNTWKTGISRLSTTLLLGGNCIVYNGISPGMCRNCIPIDSASHRCQNEISSDGESGYLTDSTVVCYGGDVSSRSAPTMAVSFPPVDSLSSGDTAFNALTGVSFVHITRDEQNER
jgi:hypothetical protein